MKRSIRWILINGIFAACLWLWFAQGMAGGRYVATFYVWTTFCLSLFLLSANVREAACNYESFRNMSAFFAWIDALFDFAVTLVLVWHGEILLGSLYLVHALLISGAVQAARKARASHA